MRDRELTSEFFTKYSQNKERAKNLTKAYELTEKEWQQKNGERFYKSVNSFRAAKSHHVRKTGRLV